MAICRFSNRKRTERRSSPGANLIAHHEETAVIRSADSRPWGIDSLIGGPRPLPGAPPHSGGLQLQVGSTPTGAFDYPTATATRITANAHR